MKGVVILSLPSRNKVMREWGESSAVFVVAKGGNFFRTAFSCTAPVPRPRRLVGWRGCPVDARLLPRVERRRGLLTWSRFFEILVCQFHHEEVGTFFHLLPLFTTKFAKHFATVCSSLLFRVSRKVEVSIISKKFYCHLVS